MREIMLINLIQPEETYQLRNKILRPGFSIENCHYPNDHDDQCFHLGHRNQDETIDGICTAFLEDIDSEFLIHKQGIAWRIRGMAVDQEKQSQGIGKQLVLQAMEEVKKRGGALMWCNARTSALGFYQSLGFVAIGNEFDIATVGPHFVAIKTL